MQAVVASKDVKQATELLGMLKQVGKEGVFFFFFFFFLNCFLFFWGGGKSGGEIGLLILLLLFLDFLKFMSVCLRFWNRFACDFGIGLLAFALLG